MTTISNVKQCIATLKGIQAQLTILALQSQDEDAQKIFHESMLTIQEIRKELYKKQVELE